MSTARTKYIPGKGVFIGKEQVMTAGDVKNWVQTFKAGAEQLDDLKLLPAKEIAKGGHIGHRAENQSFQTINRDALIMGGFAMVPPGPPPPFGLKGFVPMPPGPAPPPIGGPFKGPIKLPFKAPVAWGPGLAPPPWAAPPPAPIHIPAPRHCPLSISTPSLFRCPRREYSSYRDPFRLMNYLDLPRDSLARDIDRARKERQIEDLEREIEKERSKSRTRRRRRSRKKTPKKKSSRKKKRKPRKKKSE